MFRTFKYSSSGRLARAVLQYFFVHPYKQSGRSGRVCHSANAKLYKPG